MHPSERTHQPEQFDLKRVDPRIAETLDVSLAREAATMPDQWMLSYHPERASKEQLAAAEWDPKLITYSETLLAMAAQAEALQATVPPTAENRAAIYSARSALLSEANAYYNPVRQRMGAGYGATLHWETQTKKALEAATARGFSPEDQRFILAGRLQAITTELETILTMVRTGGWNNPQEKNRYCGLLDGTRSAAVRQSTLDLWSASGGETAEFDTLWSEFDTAITNYLEQFQAEPAPDGATILGEARLAQYFQELGLTESPAELVARCETERLAVSAELDRLVALHPEVTQEDQSYPESDQAIIQAAQDTTRWFQEHLIDQSDLIPRGTDVTDMRPVIRTNSKVSDINFAALDPGNTSVYYQPAANQEIWKPNWKMMSVLTTHELAHIVQRKVDVVPTGWKSMTASEGAAVAMEWLKLGLEKPTPQAMYQYLQLQLRRSVRMKTALEFHQGTLPATELKQRGQQEARLTTEQQSEDFIESTQGAIGTTTAYWLGPQLILALANAEHHGDFKAALRQVAHSSGLRLPGHVFMQGDPNHFSLTTHVDAEPLPVKMSKQYFPDHP